MGSPLPQEDLTSARTYGKILPVRRKLRTPDIVTVLQTPLKLQRVGALDAQVFVPAIDHKIAAGRPLRLSVLDVRSILTY